MFLKPYVSKGADGASVGPGLDGDFIYARALNR